MKFLGLFDILIVFLLWAASAGQNIGWILAIGCSVILIAKGLLGMNFATVIDVGCAILLIISLFAVLPWWIYFIFMILIGQKGIVSMFS